MATPAGEDVKQCTACGSVFPVTAFNRRTKSRDGRASVCRRCASAERKTRGKVREHDALRAAIKAGEFERVRDLFSTTSHADQLLTQAATNYNTAGKHDGHARIVELFARAGGEARREALFEAARDGNQAIVDRLVAAGAELDLFACALIGDVDGAANHLGANPH